jgi:hypothetical protein
VSAFTSRSDGIIRGRVNSLQRAALKSADSRREESHIIVNRLIQGKSCINCIGLLRAGARQRPTDKPKPSREKPARSKSRIALRDLPHVRRGSPTPPKRPTEGLHRNALTPTALVQYNNWNECNQARSRLPQPRAPERRLPKLAGRLDDAFDPQSMGVSYDG